MAKNVLAAVGRSYACSCSQIARRGAVIPATGRRPSYGRSPWGSDLALAQISTEANIRSILSAVMATQLVLDIGTDRSPAGPKRLDHDLGEVFTRRWMVEFILDLAGYTADRDLGSSSAVEPSCGEGAFLGPMMDRLLASAVEHNRDPTTLASAIRAYDLSPENVELARKAAVARLVEAGVTLPVAHELAERWVVCDDFLLAGPEEATADFVIGNPPYVRLENVPEARTAAYRRACPTMRGRSDVYVGFIERGLRVLADDGVLAFIVADRWMHNQYGAELRRLVVEHFSMDTVIEMHEVDAFEDHVSAYPAVTVIRRCNQGHAVLAHARKGFGAEEGERLRSWAARSRSTTFQRPSVGAARLPTWFPGDELWPSGDPLRLSIVADLEQRFPPLEDPMTRTRVGIGVASGADSVYLTTNPHLVEEDRLLPLLMSADIVTGEVRWKGTYLVNPWEGGQLVDLDSYPLLARHLQAHDSTVRARHIAKKRPSTWYRTIDRVDPALASMPKLVLPDLKASIHPVLDEGRLYPHHNLYFVVSDGWDIDVLGGILLSDVANLLVGAYCVKMRGGCYRFQAQYLRRIRVPRADSLSREDKRALAESFADRDTERATALTVRLYGIDSLPTLK